MYISLVYNIAANISEPSTVWIAISGVLVSLFISTCCVFLATCVHLAIWKYERMKTYTSTSSSTAVCKKSEYEEMDMNPAYGAVIGAIKKSNYTFFRAPRNLHMHN